MITITLDGVIVKRSKNLRGILEYAHQTATVSLLHIFKNADGSGYAYIVFSNGAESNVTFADYGILKAWAENRLARNQNFMGADYSWQ